MSLGTVKKPIIARLGNRFNISQSATQLDVANELVAITNVDDLLRTYQLKEISVTVTASPATILEVPANKRYFIHTVAFYTASTERADAIGINGGTVPQNTYLGIKSFSATSNYKSDMFAQPIRLEPGHRLVAGISTPGATPITFWVSYSEEDIY